MRYKSGDLLGYAVLMLTLHLNGRVEGGGVCKDSQGHTYNTGFLYIPEPCTVCVCDNGSPKWCKAVICTLSQKPMPKQDCKSFRIDGTPCCEFICLDDTLSSGTNDKSDGIENSSETSANYDLGLRLVASCFTAILSLSLLFFLIHRLRQRKIRVCVAGRQNRQLTDDQRTLGNMGYLERGGLPHGVQMDDLACGGGYPLWKPPGNYFPRGEAPPPYEEAVAAARAEQALLSMQQPHATLSPLNLQNTYLTTHTIHPTVTLVTGMQNTLTANSPTPSNHIPSPSSSSSCGTSRQLSQINSHCHQQQNHQQIQQIDNNSLSSGGVVGVAGGGGVGVAGGTSGYYNNTIVNTNYNVGTSTYENLPGPITLSNIAPQQQQHTNVNNHFNNINNNTNNNSNNNITNNTNNKNNNNLNNNSNNNINNNTNNCHQLQSTISNNINTKNYHTTLPRQGSAFTISTNTGISTHRTIPRTLATSNHLRIRRDLLINQSVLCDTKKINNITSTINKLPNSAPPIVTSSNKLLQKKFNIETLKDFKFNHSINKNDDAYCKIEAGPSNINSAIKKPTPLISRAGTNQDESFDSVTCHCSMQALPTMHDDADDYRSECENCKSATGSRYYLDNEDELVTSPHETMTLHRRPEETTTSVTPQYYRTSLTLPTSTRQRTSTGGRNWFNSMPESSTESSDDD
ncbi:putative uncharacterized protein DDB_G0292292 isoform X2 [Aphidius gifuensis]|uniref:putative uncharacterized protein DDB_G0292292 isoform X2 n=1 Tax=Aphidius gifuensis TaxID=684658 RepID=UPI001CDD23FB|nr:putative uncharacterized protein DDB_G0292292 isoform X2 [Aphidius gifuensis]